MATCTQVLEPGRRQTLGAVLIPLILSVAAASCGDPSNRSGPSPLTYLRIDGPATVAVGSTASFKAVLEDFGTRTIRDVTQEVPWSSSDPAVLSVEQGLAKGLRSGSAVLQVRLSEQAFAFRVHVQGAVLAIERPSVIVHGSGASGFWYEPRFLLTETSGNSGATIQEIQVHGPAGSDITGSGCWQDAIRVPPGGTLDTFFTDAGAKWLVYCAPGTSGGSATAQIRVVVSFVDDGGHRETVEAVVTAAK